MRAKEVIRALDRLGFVISRQSGSHIRLIHPGSPSAGLTVSMHAGEDLSDGNISSIIRQAGITRAEFEQARRNRL